MEATIKTRGFSLADFGIVFSKKDIEDRIGDTVSAKQLAALVFELEDAFEYYFQADLLEQWKEELQTGIPAEEVVGNPDEFKIEVSEDTVGKFIYDKAKVQQVLESEISDREFAFIVDYFDRAFTKYFNEECERLWADIDAIVEEFEQ